MLRPMARPMLATIFVLGGINALRDSQGHAQAAKPWLDKTIGKQSDNLPDAVPTEPVTLIRIDAAVKVGGGLALAAGKMPRLASVALLGSLVPTTLAAHSFWEFSDESQRQQQMIQFAKNVSVAGGLVMAATDTKGRPSLGWRARKAAKQASKQVQETSEQAQKRGGKLSKKARKQLNT